MKKPDELLSERVIESALAWQPMTPRESLLQQVAKQLLWEKSVREAQIRCFKGSVVEQHPEFARLAGLVENKEN